MFKPFVPYVIFTTRATCCLSKLCAIRHTFKLCATCTFKLVPYVSSLNLMSYAISTPRATCCISKLCAIYYTSRLCAICRIFILCAICYTSRLCTICRIFKLVPCHIFKLFVSHVASLYCVPYIIPLDCVPYVASLYCVPYAISLSRSCHRHPFLLSCPQFTPMSITVKLQRKCAVKYASVPTDVRDMNF
jgi:hypothetical protein